MSEEEALQSAAQPAQQPAVAQPLKPKISFGKKRKPAAAEAEQAPRKRISVTLPGVLCLLDQYAHLDRDPCQERRPQACQDQPVFYLEAFWYRLLLPACCCEIATGMIHYTA